MHPDQRSPLRRVCLPTFSRVANFHRFYKCSFLRLKRNEAPRVETSRVFSVVFWLQWATCFGLAYFGSVALEESLEKLSNRDRFNVMAFAFMIVVTQFEAFFAAFTLKRNRFEWLEMLQKCDRIEMELEPTTAMLRAANYGANLSLTIQMLVILFNFVINAINDFGLGIYAKLDMDLTLNAKLAGYLFSAVGAFMIPSNATVCRIWLTYFSNLFCVYIRRMEEVLLVVLNSQAPEHEKVAAVDRFRVQLNAVREVSEMVSEVIGFGIFFGYGSTVPVLCVAGYFITMPDMHIKVRIYFAAFGFAHALSLLVPILVANRLSHVLGSLNAKMESFLLRRSPSTLSAHLVLLGRAALHEDFQIDAIRFFRVDLDLFTAIVAAVITYSVMLAQCNVQIVQMLQRQKV